MSVVKRSRPAGNAAGEDLGQTRFEERRATGRQLLDLCDIHVNTNDLVAELSHTCGVYGTQIAASNHRDFHPRNPT